MFIIIYNANRIEIMEKKIVVATRLQILGPLKSENVCRTPYGTL